MTCIQLCFTNIHVGRFAKTEERITEAGCGDDRWWPYTTSDCGRSADCWSIRWYVKDTVYCEHWYLEEVKSEALFYLYMFLSVHTYGSKTFCPRHIHLFELLIINLQLEFGVFGLRFLEFGLGTSFWDKWSRVPAYIETISIPMTLI